MYLPDEIIQFIFEYSNRRVRHVLLESIPFLDEGDLPVREDKAAAIFMLFPQLGGKMRKDGIYFFGDNTVEFEFEYERGFVHIHNDVDKDSLSLEEIMENRDGRYMITTYVNQTPFLEEIFTGENVTINTDVPGVITNPNFESITLTIHKQIIGFDKALEFFSKSFFQIIRDKINESFPEEIRIIVDLM